MKCWGKNTNPGELGLGDDANRGDGANEMGDRLPTVDLGTGLTATQFSLGNAHSCAKLNDGTVKCWGNNSSGELGQGDASTRGGAANQMGVCLPTINLGTGRTAKEVAAASGGSCAVLDDSTVKCWGINGTGQSGLNDAAVRGDGAGEMGDSLPTVNLGTGRTARALAGGDSHFCALLDNSTIRCWGSNTSGNLGLGDAAHRGDSTGEVGDNLPVVDLGS